MIIQIATHGGSFHADDVFAVAALLLKFPDAEVIRTRDKDVIAKADIAVDVGLEYDPKRMRFDHHQQEGAGIRSNGIPYASFGLVWKELGVELAGEEAAPLIEEKLVMPIDAPDNGVSTYDQVFENVRPYTIVDFLYSYFENGSSGEEYLHGIFMKVVGVTKELLTREIVKARERVEGMKKVREILESATDKRVIVIEKDLPWEPVLVPSKETLFVVYPRREGNWGLKGIPVSVKGFERKKYFPESWAGKEKDDLIKATGVEEAVFCHRGLWLAAAETKEGALKLAEIALNS